MDEIVCEPCDEAVQPRGIRDPGQPTAEERRLHNLTHCPFRAWCSACVKGQAKDDPHRTVRGIWAEELVPRIRADYLFLTENAETTAGEHGESAIERVKKSLTVLVAQESLCRSVWAYAVKSKGAKEDWVISQICEDLETVGLQK